MKIQIFVALLLASASSFAQSSDSELQRCSLVTDASARLACYDAMALRSANSRLDSAATPPASGEASPAAATAPAKPAPGVNSNLVSSRFGLPATKAETAPEQLQSQIVGPVESFPRNIRYRLENGQVWQVSEAAIGFYQLNSPKVKISRGALGNFTMQIEGVAAVLRVRRVQ